MIRARPASILTLVHLSVSTAFPGSISPPLAKSRACYALLAGALGLPKFSGMHATNANPVKYLRQKVPNSAEDVKQVAFKTAATTPRVCHALLGTSPIPMKLSVSNARLDETLATDYSAMIARRACIKLLWPRPRAKLVLLGNIQI